MTTILRFILFFLLVPSFAIVAQAARTFQDDFRIVDADFRTKSVILESVDGEICSYDSSGALLQQRKSIDGEDDLNGCNEFETSGATQPLFSFLAEFVATKTLDNVPTSCFIAGTLVATSTGFGEIQDISVGDQVWSYNVKTEEWELNEVVETFVHEYKKDIVTVKVGDTLIEATGNHPFWVVEGTEITARSVAVDVPLSDREQAQGGRWVEARSLKVGDVLLLQDGKHLEVVELSSRFQELLVYNIEVANNHTYAVSEIGVLVHNKAAAFRAPKALQTGGHTLNKNTLKQLGLSKQQGKQAIEGLKKDIGARNDFHAKILDNGDVVHPQTGDFVGNLFDYVP